MKINILIMLLGFLSFDVSAKCYADDVRMLKDWKVKEISVERGNYVWAMDNPKSVKCFFKIAKLESEVALLKGDFSAAEEAAEDLLNAFPGEYEGLLYMHLALKAQGKNVPEWYSVKRYPNEYSKQKFNEQLSSSIILGTANKAVK